MSTLRSALAAAVTALILAGAALAQAPNAAAQRVAADFLVLVEAGEYETAYAMFAPGVRDALRDTAFQANMLRLVGERGGPSSERAIVETRSFEEIPGPDGAMVDGEFFGVRFATNYPSGPVVENVMLEREAASWSVVGYFWTPDEG